MSASKLVEFLRKRREVIVKRYDVLVEVYDPTYGLQDPRVEAIETVDFDALCNAMDEFSDSFGRK